MKIQIQSPDFTAKQSLVEFIEEKVNKLERFSDRLLEARIVLRLDKSDTRENKVCEMRLVVPGNDLFVKQQCKTFEEAADKVVKALERKIKDWKGKLDQS